MANTIKVNKYLSRVFTTPGSKKGGNPLTIFLFHESIHSIKRKIPVLVKSIQGNDLNEKPANSFQDVESFHSSLARSCDWESVIVYLDNEEGSDTNMESKKTLPEMMFYMPLGTEVSFCAHAAVGACMAIFMERQNDVFNWSHDKNGAIVKNSDVSISKSHSSVFPFDMQFTTSKGDHQHSANILNSNLVELKMTSSLKENDVMLLKKQSMNKSTENFDPYKITKELLNEIGLHPEDVAKSNLITNSHKKSNGFGQMIPRYLNSSIARTKTLIPISSLDRLHAATNPRNKDNFRSLCESIDSTGIYLYSRLEKNEHDLNANQNSSNLYECRQFPSASGYPEDPATGIAAAALAASLHSRKIADIIFDNNDTRNHNDQLQFDDEAGKYTFYQGTAMQKKSLIQIRFEQLRNDGGVNHPNSAMISKEKKIDLFCSGFVDIDCKSVLEI